MTDIVIYPSGSQSFVEALISFVREPSEANEAMLRSAEMRMRQDEENECNRKLIAERHATRASVTVDSIDEVKRQVDELKKYIEQTLGGK